MLQSSSLPFLDLEGNLRSAHALSLLDRKYFLTLRESCLKLAPNTDLRLSYDRSPEFSELVNACLLMSGISPAWVDSGMACRLLFGVGDELPLLMQLNFPARAAEDDETGEGIPEGYDPESYAIASLWAATDNLETALRLARNEPYSLLSEVLRSRAYQIKKLDPKQQEKEALEEAGDRLSSLGQSGKLDKALDRMLERNGN